MEWNRVGCERVGTRLGRIGSGASRDGSWAGFQGGPRKGKFSRLKVRASERASDVLFSFYTRVCFLLVSSLCFLPVIFILSCWIVFSFSFSFHSLACVYRNLFLCVFSEFILLLPFLGYLMSRCV